MTDLPHKCGKVLDYCELRENYRILYCVFCKQVVGYEKDGFRYIVNFNLQQYKKKQYSEETLNDSV